MEKLPEVLVVPESVTADELGAFVERGELPPGAEMLTLEEFSARGRAEDCDCKLITCVCVEARQHQVECRYRRALTCPIPIGCEDHERYVCPECDACDCAPAASPGL